MWRARNVRRCAKCGLSALGPDGEWRTLELHHKNGDYTDNRTENKEPLCKQCHSEIDGASIRPKYWDMKNTINDFFDGGKGTTLTSLATSLGFTPVRLTYWLTEYGLMDLVNWHKEYIKLSMDGAQTQLEEQWNDIIYPAEM